MTRDDDGLDKYLERLAEERKEAHNADKRAQARDLISSGNARAAAKALGIDLPEENRVPSITELELGKQDVLSQINISRLLTHPFKSELYSNLYDVDVTSPAAIEELNALRMRLQGYDPPDIGPLLTRSVNDFDTLDIQRGLSALETACCLYQDYIRSSRMK